MTSVADGKFVDRDLSVGPPDYDAGVLTTIPQNSIIYIKFYSNIISLSPLLLRPWSDC